MFRSSSYPALAEFLGLFSAVQSVNKLHQGLNDLVMSGKTSINDLLQIYRDAVSIGEELVWADGYDAPKLAILQRLYREMEGEIRKGGVDERHHFIVTVPVADRPRHLQNCLQSLLEMCRQYGYGGGGSDEIEKVSVLIADDSKDLGNVQLNREIAHEFTRKGLSVIYFDQDEQKTLVAQLPELLKGSLAGVVGSADGTDFSHKGASIMRNIAYLKLKQLAGGKHRVLCWFIDSDQEFKVNVEPGDQEVFAINYFYHLDRIFTETKTQTLTGKVVGDPPVSPSVMAVNFTVDVISFLQQMSLLKADQVCQFHSHGTQKADDAAYHDMADMFGFKPAAQSFNYQCPLGGVHDHEACFMAFSRGLDRFFDGEHQTRRNFFEYKAGCRDTTPARTVYTGNYVLSAEALDYFIPFADLKLRMAGPVLGRLLKSELGDRFVSANLPMLHKRTISHTGRSEFRPGIERERDRVDLSGEYERQYFGDVMLFTAEELARLGYPVKRLGESEIRSAIESTEEKMQQQYGGKHALIMSKLDELHSLLNKKEAWWNNSPDLEEAKRRFTVFIEDMEYNFGPNAAGYQLITDDGHRRDRRQEILQALMEYKDTRAAWHQVLMETAGQ